MDVDIAATAAAADNGTASACGGGVGGGGGTPGSRNPHHDMYSRRAVFRQLPSAISVMRTMAGRRDVK